MKHFICIIILLCSVSSLFSQGSPKNIKQITGHCTDAKGDTIVKNCIKKIFSKTGKILSDADNRYYIIIDYKYDSSDRIIEKEALYGESFANGTTKFTYKKNSVTEQEFAGGYYRESVINFDNKGDTLSTERFFASEFMADNSLETKEYFYNKKGQKTSVKVKILYYNDAPGISSLDEPGKIKNAVFSSGITDSSVYKIKFTYNRNGKLTKEFNKDAGLNHKKQFIYDEVTNLIHRELHYMDSLLVFDKLYKYSNGQLLDKEIITEKILLNGNVSGDNIKETKKTVQYFYNTTENILKTIKTRNNKISEIAYFENNKLIKTEEFDSDEILFETIYYDYEFY